MEGVGGEGGRLEEGTVEVAATAGATTTTITTAAAGATTATAATTTITTAAGAAAERDQEGNVINSPFQTFLNALVVLRRAKRG